MGHKLCWTIIIITIAVNVVMLQWTIEAYLGREYETMYVYTIVGVISAIIAFITYLKWRKIEYTK